MEAKSGNVVDFDHILFHIRNTTPFEFDQAVSMKADEMRAFIQETAEKRLRLMHGLLTEQVTNYLVQYQQKNQRYVDIPRVCEEHFKSMTEMKDGCTKCEAVTRSRKALISAHYLSCTQLVAFTNLCAEKLRRSIVEPGTAWFAGEISEYIEQVFTPDDSFVLVKLSAKRIRLLQLEVTIDMITYILSTAKLPIPLKGRRVQAVGKTMIVIHAPEDDGLPISLALHYLKYSLPSIVIKG
ncbi:DNA-directed RNA polymerase subunit [Aphelenchoides fujianensis]|nr:DNA-directed RNA polymerase subunit [Aphelenchoides fujianensis]